MIGSIDNYINFSGIHDDLMDEYKEIGDDLFSENIPKNIKNLLKGFFEDGDAVLTESDCEIRDNEIILTKGLGNIGANESDTQGSFFCYWIKYCFDTEKIIDGDYEQG
jgi:hypothetical protein